MVPLSKLVIDFAEDVAAISEKLWDEAFAVGFDVLFDTDQFNKELKELGEDAYPLEEFWYKQFGPSYWCGIMSAYPWGQIPGGCPNADDETELWRILLKYHVAWSPSMPYQIRFRFNKESPINTWLQRHSGIGDVPYNVESLFQTAVNFILRDEDSIFTWEMQEDVLEDEL